MRGGGPLEITVPAYRLSWVRVVPVLLSRAVCARLAVLKLALPAADTEAVPPENGTLGLSVIVRTDELQVVVSGSVLQSFELTESGFDLQAVNSLVVKVRERIPAEVTSVTVLLEPDVDYDQLIQVMDAVRMKLPDENTVSVSERTPLFPDVAIGDAPPRATESNG